LFISIPGKTEAPSFPAREEEKEEKEGGEGTSPSFFRHKIFLGKRRGRGRENS